MIGTLLGTPSAQASLSMQSPWWENYDSRESYLCNDRATIVLERNESQASLIAGGLRSTLFRESSRALGVSYRNDSMRLILSGDVLTVERLPLRFTCVRTEQV